VAESKSERSSRNPFSAISQYWREMRAEVRKVTWPTREEATRLTGIVLAVTAAMTVFLFTFDYIFSSTMKFLVNAFLGI
jgi:preprotein translocase subunit SecE